METEISRKLNRYKLLGNQGQGMDTTNRTREDILSQVVPPDDELFDNESRLLTYDDLAEVLKVDQRTLRRWVRRNEIPYVRLGRRVRFFPERIRDWLKEKGA